VSVLSQASVAESVASTTSRVLSTALTVVSCPRAAVSAAAPLSLGVTARVPIARLCATEVYFTWPAPSTTTTKSPPRTGRPL